MSNELHQSMGIICLHGSLWTTMQCRRANIARLNKGEGRERNRIFLYLFPASAWSILTWPTLFKIWKLYLLHYTHSIPYIHPRKPDFIVDGTRGLVKKYIGSLFESYFEIIFLTSFAFVINYVIMILISECFVKREFCNIENKCSLSKWRQIFNVIWIFENCVSIVHHFYLRHKM